MEELDTQELIKRWRLSWLGSLHQLSDYSLQLYSWRGGLEPNNPHWSFVEFMCCYFDSLSLSEGYDWARNDGFVSEEEVSAVTDFHTAAQNYEPPKGDWYDHEAILQDEKWQDVIRSAVTACERLLSILTDPTELAILSRIRANNSFKGMPLRGTP